MPRQQPASAAATNAAFYGTLTAGREDYWRKMAAPRYRISTLLSLIDEHHPGRVVDLGCGNGLLLSEIHRCHPTTALCGIDLSPAQVEQNRARLPGIRWFAADLTDASGLLAELCGKFDAVIASELVEHVDDAEVVLRNARLLASQGGFLFLSTQSGPIREMERIVGHVRHFSRDHTRALLMQAGWEPVRVWNCGFPFHDLSKWLANIRPAATMERFGGERYGLFENLVCAGLRVAFRFNSRARGAQLFAVARRAEPPS